MAAGQPMLTLEAMKMEHVHLAPCAGTVLALLASLGEQVAAQRVLAECRPLAERGLIAAQASITGR